MQNKMTRNALSRAYYLSTWLIAVLLTLTAAVTAAYGAEVNTHAIERPGIGLVLSGGGARGIAHIGILKRLEELQIPIDYIAGTSMGSIIGALYATGKTAHELEQLVATIDWELAFTDDTPRSLLPMHRKIEQSEFLIDLELGVKRSGVVLPKGAIQGQNLHLILKSLFQTALTVDDFDDLPIPFRAVASDIESSEPVILSSGDLATAIQASMAIPGVFAPVQIDGKTLVDGGVTKNLPVDVVRDMGADIVIAVDISTPLLKPEELQSALNILDQLTNILNQTNLREQLGQLDSSDILIRPELEQFTSASFDQVSGLVQAGESAVEHSIHLLELYKLDMSAYNSHRSKIHQRIKPKFTPDYVTVLQNSALSSESLRNRLRIKPAVPLDQNLLHEDVERIHGLGVFQSVGYHVQQDQGIAGLVVRAAEKEWGPNYLKFGLQLEDDFEGDSKYNLAFGIRREPINRLGGEATIIVKGGTDPELKAEYYQPLNGLEDYYFQFDVGSRRYTADWYVNGERVAEYRVRTAETRLALGYQFNNFVDLRLGAHRSMGNALRTIGDESYLREADFDDGGVSLALRYDTLDSLAFARNGHRGLLRVWKNTASFGADTDWSAGELRGLAVKSLGQFSFALKYFLAGSRDDDAPLQSLFQLGGFQNLSGFSQNSLSGQHAAFLGFGLYYPVTGSVSGKFETPIYLGATLESGNVWQRREDIDDSTAIFAGSVYVGANTAVGPAYLGFGQAEGGQSSFYFSLGYLF